MEGDIYGSTFFGTSKNILTHLFSLLPMLHNTTSYKSSYCHQKYVSMITTPDVMIFQKNIISHDNVDIVSINELSIKTILSFIIIEFIYTFDIYWIQLSLKYLSLCKPCHMERVISVKSNIILQIYFSSIYETDWRCYDYDRHCFSDKAVISRQGSCHNI